MDKTFIKQEIAGIRDQAQAVMLRLDRLQEFVDELTLNAAHQPNGAELDIQEAPCEADHEYQIKVLGYTYCYECGAPLLS